MEKQVVSKDVQKLSFWSLETDDVILKLNTHADHGLTNEEAKLRLQIFGENIIENTKSTSAFSVLINQLKSPLILLLIFAGAVTLFIQHFRDALFIFSAVFVNTVLGFYQEYKAEKAISELKSYLKQRSRVVRGGVERDIDAIHVVPGDIIRLSQGDRVPADARVLYANDVQVDEAILTGESLPVSKTIDPVGGDTVLADQSSMVFAGTLVTQGVITAVVCRTDFSTELGKIAELVAESHREDTPLQGAIKKFSLRAGLYLTILTVIIFFIGIAFGQSRVEMFLLSVAIAVSAVPEGLPVAMTVILATGVQRMAKRKGVVRKLVAAEALGSTSIILTDKTGTLTMAKMELSQIIPIVPGGEKALLESSLVNTHVLIENPGDSPSDWRMSGRSIETALVGSAGIQGTSVIELKKNLNIVAYLPFNAVNKFSASLVHVDQKKEIIFFGAPDILVRYSTLSLEEQRKIHQTIDELASDGELVLGVATKVITGDGDFNFESDLELNNFVFQGLITLRDKVRPTVADAIKKVEKAGIRIVVMTGDHKGTALSIAREVGIHVDEDGVIDGTALRDMSDEVLSGRLKTLSIVSRVTPEDKLRIVKAFQGIGEVVAMTGDGVNDAPSIQRADIGIAMGSGTEVTRDVADLVLLDDNFETIAAAVEEGRQIMSNIRKVLVYLLSSVTDALLLIGGSIIVGIPLPMNALQILWVNFFSDSFPAIGYAFEKDDGLSGKRVPGKVTLFNPLMKFLIIFIGFSTSLFLFGLYYYLLKIGYDGNLVRTFIYTSFGTYSLFLALSVRSLDKSIFSYPFLSNTFLLYGVLVGLVLMMASVYIPLFQKLFETVALPLPWLLGVVGVGILNMGLIEFGKMIFRYRARVRVA